MRGTITLFVAGVIALAFSSFGERTAQAQGSEPVKPYIVFVIDVSGSMLAATGSGPPSCGGQDTRLDHAKCALTNIVNTYGDVVVALGRFRVDQNVNDNNCGNGCGVSGIDCESCANNLTAGTCTAALTSADRFELLVPLTGENQSDLLNWVDLTCGTCSLTSSNNPELEASGWTPIAGSLKGVKRYMQGLNTPGTDTSVGMVPYWTGAGADPIRNDPLKNTFLPGGEQCRPYITVMLTDGGETCDISPLNGPANAAASLLVTSVDGRDYRIETKPIGFGIAPGDPGIENLAHGGGAVDVGGVNEGFYAADEVGISNALAQIIGDALKFELCNELDDDCDGAIDEDFPLKGGTCDNGLFGICKSDGVFICSADQANVECQLNNPNPPVPGTVLEICNNLDDDCDGKIDEAPADCTGCQSFELCDGIDNNCNGLIDEGLTQVCGTDVGICTTGTETCVEGGTGQWGPCSGTPPDPPERCDGLDNDCDGTVDGLQEECSAISGGNPNVGICRPGTRTCPTDGSGWSACIGEVVPEATDPCDGADNDCDGTTDEDFTPSDCSSTCGLGTTECVGGAIVCNGSNNPVPEICNGNDDDCDGVVDEEIPPGGPCDDDGRCLPGELICDASTGGQFECRGGTLPGIEICDCEDNDCDSQIDEEDPNPLCAPGASCVDCQCAFPCENSEFPCPVGRFCANGFCLLDPCYGIDCQPDTNGDQTQCVDGDCVRSCDVVTCAAGQVCRGGDGSCQPDNCIAFPDKCMDDEFCVGGACVADPCFDVTCNEMGSYCVDGSCVSSCAGVDCPEGQRCELGTCATDPCGENCPEGQVCNKMTGSCGDDPCSFSNCPAGQACNSQTGVCEADPCLGVTCPGSGQVCVDGSCYNPGDLLPPDKGPPPEFVAPGGGGGCSLSAGGTSDGNRGMALLGLLFAALVVARRRCR